MHPIQFLVTNLILPVLQFFYEFSGNYGLAIILITVAIKMVTYPLTVKQFQSMEGIKKVQPELKEIQKKYKDNPQVMQSKIMGLYKEHKVNPLGGCLPLLIQFPFLIALFVALNSEAFRLLISQEGVNATFLWLKDLGGSDPTMILPILIAISTYLSQKTMSTAASKDDPQMKIMQFFPVLMLFISFKLPSGVLIYWAVSQFLTAGQQYFLQQKNKDNDESDPQKNFNNKKDILPVLE